ncbi:MAG: hypothetical protein FJW35_16000 [Acidobacteria bacterium]|nr:hypothetical protein [Acidobacteriota bacterium]
MILGTAACVSPEQARGKPLDNRTDIRAFGVVLFEMLTGQVCFDGETVTDVLAEVMRADPDWTKLPAGVPLRLRSLLRRCLAKNRRQNLVTVTHVFRDDLAVPEPAQKIGHRQCADAGPVLGSLDTVCLMFYHQTSDADPRIQGRK